ncbi:C1q-related factor-like [Dicentrarchus labrax]|uniref:C1q-related factor-like n=1 Tax=Dicentrarchus labrax TaxID=13489 RepID=UPI0021F55248|nr:C1q-related factor-like [Dicentrarchus labrax]
MRAIVLLCLLHAAFGQDNRYGWNGPSSTVAQPNQDRSSECLADPASCGCCLMQKQVERMEMFFNYTYAEMKKEMTKTKVILDNMRASRSAFSVALNNNISLTCFGPFTTERFIIYKNVFINLGNNYNVQTGVFTAPRSGVYSLSITVYSSSVNLPLPCANLLVNSKMVTSVKEQNGQDSEDSGSAVWAMKLMAGDQVAVVLPQGCAICDDKNHYNTFTGFLLYATD